MSTGAKCWLVLLLVLLPSAVMQAQENAVPDTREVPAAGPSPATPLTLPTLPQPVPGDAKSVLGETKPVVDLPEAAKWSLELDDDSFEVREAAAKKLMEAGPPAAYAVRDAAQGERLEASTRAFAILDKWLDSDDAQTQATARKTLQELSEAPEEPMFARRAKSLLAKARSTSSSSGVPTLVRGGVHVLPGARLEIGRAELRAAVVFGGGVKGRSTRISIANGQKTIEITEDGTKTQIVESEKEGIKIQVTAKDKEGKEVTTKYEAKNLEELKEKQPEGFKVYEKNAGAMKGIQIRMEAGAAAPAFDFPPALAPKIKIEARGAELKKKADEQKQQALKQAEEKANQAQPQVRPVPPVPQKDPE